MTSPPRGSIHNRGRIHVTSPLSPCFDARIETCPEPSSPHHQVLRRMEGETTVPDPDPDLPVMPTSWMKNGVTLAPFTSCPAHDSGHDRDAPRQATTRPTCTQHLICHICHAVRPHQCGTDVMQYFRLVAAWRRPRDKRPHVGLEPCLGALLQPGPSLGPARRPHSRRQHDWCVAWSTRAAHLSCDVFSRLGHAHTRLSFPARSQETLVASSTSLLALPFLPFGFAVPHAASAPGQGCGLRGTTLSRPS